MFTNRGAAAPRSPHRGGLKRAPGLKTLEVSRRASGHPYLIYKLRKGVTPSFDTMARLCESLGVEFSVGLPQGTDMPAAGRSGHPLR